MEFDFSRLISSFLLRIRTQASGGRVAGKARRALATKAAGRVATNRTLSATTEKALGEVAFVDI